MEHPAALQAAVTAIKLAMRDLPAPPPAAAVAAPASVASSAPVGGPAAPGGQDLGPFELLEEEDDVGAAAVVDVPVTGNVGSGTW